MSVFFNKSADKSTSSVYHERDFRFSPSDYRFLLQSGEFSDQRPVHLDAVAAWESIQRVKALGATILPLHDLGLKKIGG